MCRDVIQDRADWLVFESEVFFCTKWPDMRFWLKVQFQEVTHIPRLIGEIQSKPLQEFLQCFQFELHDYVFCSSFYGWALKFTSKKSKLK